MKIDIIKQTVAAKTRRLTATWTYEVSEELESEYGIDVEKEIYLALMWEDGVNITQDKLCEYGIVSVSRLRREDL